MARRREHLRDTRRGRHQRGSALTIALAAVAILAVAILALGVERSFGPGAANDEARPGIAGAEEAGRLSSGEGTSEGASRSGDVARDQGPKAGAMAAASSAAAEVGGEESSGLTPKEVARRAASARSLRRKLPAASQKSGIESALERLAERRRADRAARGEWTPGRSMPSPENDFVPGDGEPDPDAVPYATGFGNRPLASWTGPPGTPFEPGYVDVVGVSGRTVAHEAGIRRGMRILEYDGAAVAGSLALDEAISRAELSGTDRVSVVVEDRNGQVFSVDVEPGPLGASLPPRYNE